MERESIKCLRYISQFNICLCSEPVVWIRCQTLCHRWPRSCDPASSLNDGVCRQMRTFDPGLNVLIRHFDKRCAPRASAIPFYFYTGYFFYESEYSEGSQTTRRCFYLRPPSSHDCASTQLILDAPDVRSFLSLFPVGHLTCHLSGCHLTCSLDDHRHLQRALPNHLLCSSTGA